MITLDREPPDVEALKRLLPGPQAYRSYLSKWLVNVNDACIDCGICAEVCPFGVHERKEGFLHLSLPKSQRCIGEACETQDFYCVKHCPVDAIAIERNPLAEILGNPRWTNELIMSTWAMAETGRPPGGGSPRRPSRTCPLRSRSTAAGPGRASRSRFPCTAGACPSAPSPSR